MLGLSALTLSATAASAAPITVPIGVTEPYRLAFLTSIGRGAESSNIADYNAFVTGVADAVTELAALGTDWFAIASTPTVDARDNTGTNPSATGVPIFLLDGTKLADDNADLWDGTVDTRLHVLETGVLLSGNGPIAWTGTNTDGTGFDGNELGSPAQCGFACLVFGDDPISVAEIGNSAFLSGVWISAGGGINFEQDADHRFYAISGLITNQVPEPGVLGLFGIGLLGLGVARRRKAASTPTGISSR